jgi:hypothetical protein
MQTGGAPVATEDAATHLARCDQMVTDALVPPARACFEELQRRFPGTPEARDADRALALMKAMAAAPPPTPVGGVLTSRPAPPPRGDSFYLLEPFSRRTNERTRLTTWEKLDFGITAFIYGMSTGISLSLASEAEVAGPLVAGALVYTGLAVGYVSAANPDRGDLPLTLAIASYMPLTVGLVALATEWDSPRAVPATIASVGVAALPIAGLVAANTDLDPGDTQLVRDAGFWGLVLSFTTALAIDDVSTRSAGVAGLLGLYGGLGLGVIAASRTEVSLERVRVATWGGYGGALIGGLIAIAGEATEKGVFSGIAGGAAAGLLITFLGAGGVDAPPDNARFEENVSYLEPALLPYVARNGRTEPKLGISVVRGRF